jgi:hypothetical protein
MKNFVNRSYHVCFFLACSVWLIVPIYELSEYLGLMAVKSEKGLISLAVLLITVSVTLLFWLLTLLLFLLKKRLN